MSEDLYPKMTEYLKGQLSDHDTHEFEKLLESNPELLDTFEDHEIVNELRRKLRAASVRRSMATIRKEHQHHQLEVVHRKTTNRRIVYWAVAASFLALAVYFNFFFSPALNDSTFYAMLTDLVPAEELKKTDTDSILSLANQAFENEEYPKAETWYESLITKTPEFSIGYMWLGLSRMYQGDYTGALASFESPGIDQLIYKERIDLYKAMALMRLDRDIEARAILNRLIDQDSDFSAEAKKLLKRL